MHNLGSDGYNPLALLDPNDDEFFDKAKELTLAMIEGEGETNQFFPRTARATGSATTLEDYKILTETLAACE